MRLLKNWWPSGLCVAVILYATLWPDPTADIPLPVIPGLDKLIHAVMMGGLTGALCFDWQRCHRTRRLGLATVMTIAGGVAGFSLVDEWLQGILTVTRTPEALDLAADVFGILVSAATAPPAVRAIFKR